MDFGIAKTANLSLTRTGMAMGTPYYMAPEQVSGRPATPLVDIYAWGMLLFELLTGLRGVTGGTMESVFYQILNQPLDEAAMEKAGVPRGNPRAGDEGHGQGPARASAEFRGGGRGLAGFSERSGRGPRAEPREAAPATPAPRPVRVPESPAPPIIRLSIVVYGMVTVVALLAVGTWFWMGRPKFANEPRVRPGLGHRGVPQSDGAGHDLYSGGNLPGRSRTSTR